MHIFPARESLVSDIPEGDGKIDNLFLQSTVISLKHPDLDSSLCIDLKVPTVPVSKDKEKQYGRLFTSK
jgi:hypothetical protein